MMNFAAAISKFVSISFVFFDWVLKTGGIVNGYV